MARSKNKSGYVPHRGFHWHEGMAHDHEHELVGHHGPPFGKKYVVEVESDEWDKKALDELLRESEPVSARIEPSLELLLKRSIEKEEAKRDN